MPFASEWLYRRLGCRYLWAYFVFDVTSGKLTDQKYKQAIHDSIKAIKKQDHVYSVTNPLSSAGQTAGLLSKDKQTAFAPVLMDVASSDLTEEIARTSWTPAWKATGRRAMPAARSRCRLPVRGPKRTA